MIYTDKKSVIEAIPTYLKKLDEDLDILERIDDRLTTYISKVLNAPDEHNKFEILGAFRFLDFVDKYDFNLTKFKKFVRFYEALRFPAEGNKMEAFKLTPIQVFQFASILGFVKDNGRRLCRRALLYVPRKFSKTTSVAALAIWDLMFGSSNAQAFVAANSFNQAGQCFNIISKTLELIDPNKQYFGRNLRKIYSKIPGKSSYIECLSASPQRLDGLNASTIILDEYSNAPTSELKNVLTSSQGNRKEPLIVTITTASTKLDYPFASIELPNYKKILEGEYEDDTVYASIFEMDEGDDWEDRKVWAKVQPHMGITVEPDFYESEYREATMDINKMIDFKTRCLNMFVQDAKADWIAKDVIDRNMIPMKLEDFTAMPLCMVSFDLSAKDDLSCVSYGMYDTVTKMYTFINHYYLPENVILSHSNSAMYKKWAKEGYLHPCGKDVVDYEKIAQDIIAASKYVRIIGVNFDSYKNKPLTNYLKAQGVKCLSPYRQVYSAFTSPIEFFEYGIYRDQIKIDSNPINSWCLRNCVIDEDNMGNRKMIKVSANRKIDGAVCIAMNLGAFMSHRR